MSCLPLWRCYTVTKIDWAVGQLTTGGWIATGDGWVARLLVLLIAVKQWVSDGRVVGAWKTMSSGRGGKALLSTMSTSYGSTARSVTGVGSVWTSVPRMCSSSWEKT